MSEEPPGGGTDPERELTTYSLGLPGDLRTQLGQSLAELRDLLLTGPTEDTARLNPPAYGTDDRRNQQWTAISGDQLLMARLDALDQVERALEANRFTLDDLEETMKAVNLVRLVVGTRLGLESDEDDDRLSAVGPTADAVALYRFLGQFLHDIVAILTAEQLG